MQCRKCGSKGITRRRAGVFSCTHCGVQPGPSGMDRIGKPSVMLGPQIAPHNAEYDFTPRQPRLRANLNPSNGGCIER